MLKKSNDYIDTLIFYFNFLFELYLLLLLKIIKRHFWEQFTRNHLEIKLFDLDLMFILISAIHQDQIHVNEHHVINN